MEDIKTEIDEMKRGYATTVRRDRASREAQLLAYSSSDRKLTGLAVDTGKVMAAMHALSSMQHVQTEDVGQLKENQRGVLTSVGQVGVEGSEGG